MNIEKYLKNYFGKSMNSDIQTPYVVYSSERIHDNIVNLRKILDEHFANAKIYYAVKACMFDKIICFMKNMVDGFDVMSALQYNALKSSGIDEEKLIYNSPYKNPKVSDYIGSSKGIVIADNLNELEQYEGYDVHAIRLNDCNVFDDNFISNGRFGISINEISTETLGSINLFHMHALSRIKNPDVVVKTYKETISMLRKTKLNKNMVIDFGGGFDSNLRMDELGISLKDIIQEYSRLLKNIECNSVIFEPGRHFVEDAAITITTIKEIKKINNENWIIVDVATDFLIPLAASRFEVYDIHGVNGTGDLYNIGDGTCSPAGVIKRNVKLENIQLGDRLIITNCGAYTYSLAETFFGVIPEAYLLEDGKMDVMLSHENAVEIANILYGGKKFYVE